MATTSAAMSDAIERDLVAADITAGYDQAQLDWLNSKKLCDICENLFKYWYARDNWETERPDHRHDTLSSLQASAEDGCPVCEMFLNSFMNEAQDKLVSPSEAQLDDQNEQGLIRFFRVKGGSYLIHLSFSTKLLGLPHSTRLKSSIELYRSC